MKSRQRGMTFLGWLILLGILAFVTLIALRLVPGYMEYLTIRSIVQSVYDQSTPESTPAQIRTDIQRRFTVNDVSIINSRDIGVTREDGRLVLHLEYEYRTPVMANVEAVLVFDKVYGPR